jgi:cobalt/nickel transport system permease protein
MHIPDGLMDPSVALVGWVEFAVAISLVLLVSGRKIREQDLPRVAILAAGIFVAQMVNFPIGGGTTGHLIGGALFAIIAGPYMAILGMTVVILIQALMFGDGGITALGLNALNMAVIAPLAGWGVFGLLEPLYASGGRLGRWAAAAAASWASVFIAAAACAGELAVSFAISGGDFGIAPTIAIPAMLAYHAVIALGEAIITVGILAYLSDVAPKLLSRKSAAEKEGVPSFRGSRIGFSAAAILAVFALILPLYFLYAAEGEDGLEQTMSDAGTGEGSAMFVAPFSYGESYFAALFAGMLGFVIAGLATVAILKTLESKNGEG